MNTRYVSGLVLVLLLHGVESAYAQQQAGKLSPFSPLPGTSLPSVPLLDVLDVVSDRSDVTFVVDARVSSNVVVGPLRTRDVTYASLLTILGNNGLAAVTIGEQISIMPLNVIRQYSLPVLTEADDSIAAQEWVTWIIPITHAPAKEMVPIVRPLLPQAGHLAANSASNSILIVDRYANVQRVREIMLRMDAMAEEARSNTQ